MSRLFDVSSDTAPRPDSPPVARRYGQKRSRQQLRPGILIALFLLLLGPATDASAAMRTGHAVVRNPERQLSAEFPGLSRVDVRYDDVTGRIDVSAAVRSPLADPSRTSALRSTRIEVHLGDAWGDEVLTGTSCDWPSRGLKITFSLGDNQARLDMGDPLDPKDDVVVPSAVSDSRLLVAATFPPRLGIRPVNLICLTGNMVGKAGFGPNEPLDVLRPRLFDGFDGSDGSVGLQAEDSLLAEFRYLHNELVRRRRDEVFNVPGATARCSPKAGSGYVTCTARARLAVIIGRPVITVRGSRTHTLKTRRDALGRTGRLLVWDQAMRVNLRWRQCPRKINARRRGRSCEVRTTLRTGRELRQTVLRKLASVIERNSRP